MSNNKKNLMDWFKEQDDVGALKLAGGAWAGFIGLFVLNHFFLHPAVMKCKLQALYYGGSCFSEAVYGVLEFLQKCLFIGAIPITLYIVWQLVSYFRKG